MRIINTSYICILYIEIDRGSSTPGPLLRRLRVVFRVLLSGLAPVGGLDLSRWIGPSRRNVTNVASLVGHSSARIRVEPRVGRDWLPCSGEYA